MKILITGNLGYVGPWVTRRLRNSYPDATLAGLDMGFFAHCLTNAAYLPEARLDLQYFGDVRVVNRNRNDLESGALHVARNVEGGLTGLHFGLDPEHRNRFRLRQQLADLGRVVDEVVAPIRSHVVRLT